MTYSIVICTKCRKHAQIIELGSSRTTRCQRCNANLMTRKLRIFFSSDSLDETISVRTQIQAQIVEKGTYMPQWGEEISSATRHKVFGEEIDMETACYIEKRNEKKKSKTDEIILEILLSGNGEMSHGDLKKAAVARDIDEEKFEDVLKKMMQAGEIYSPYGKILKIA